MSVSTYTDERCTSPGFFNNQALTCDDATAGDGHPATEVLLSSGLRWSLVRHMTPTARRQLAAEATARQPVEYTCRAESAELWLADVQARIATSPEFQRPSKRHLWARIAGCLADRVEHDARPLTWITQAEIGGIVGCTTRTVSSCVAWLRREGLVHEVIAGTRVPMASRPSDETESERAARVETERHAAAAEAESMRRARVALDETRQRARAELDAVRVDVDETGRLQARDSALYAAGCRLRAELAELGRADGDRRAELAAELSRIEAERWSLDGQLAAAYVAAGGRQTVLLPEPEQLEVPDEWVPESSRPLLNIAPVYELRRALSAAERADRDGLERAYTAVRRDKRDIFCPPSLSTTDQKSGCVGLVDKADPLRGAQTTRVDHDRRAGAERAAAGRSGSGRGDRARSRDSRAQRAAQALIRELLDPMVSDGVSERWLASRIRGSRLLDAGWSVQDLADQLHGLPENPRLPRSGIGNRRAWINARLARADAPLPPSKRAIIAQAEQVSADAAAGREVTLAPIDASRSKVRAARAVIDQCGFCDDNAWLEVIGVGVVRCNHDPDTGGW